MKRRLIVPAIASISFVFSGLLLAAEAPIDLEKEKLRMENLTLRMQIMESQYKEIQQVRDRIKAQIDSAEKPPEKAKK